ncbi:cardiolipin synthase [Anseongella ginsenosidimutans]|uniref:Cardiolipin synthase n=1 Tax=Anseongella ginsenosidimutans TaxID=496056 RepID=A0A4R3KUZ6_9SPHI|nr:phospholipase D-like domain-containing protein [Anseongella ginsenosidimutans]TCS88891.1 cardiolipin synthase [Anseongella ginsenosidimutans]
MDETNPVNHVTLVRGGAPFFEELIHLIEQAREYLQLMFYIFDEDATGEMVLDALSAAARRGVTVYLVVDGYGSKPFSESRQRELRKAGVKFRSFAPIKGIRFSSVGRRMHTKTIVCDHKMAMVGGINISDKYHGSDTQPAWLDYAVKVSGPDCQRLHSLYELFWKRSFLNPRQIRNKEKIIEGIMRKGDYVNWLVNDRLRGFNLVSKSYFLAVHKARHEVIILNSYFWPGINFIRELRAAGERGVSVKLILPALSDSIIFRNATRYFYKVLFRIKNTEVYEWKQSVLHGKVALADDTWATVGSYNLNMLSAFRSIELNAVITDGTFISSMRAELGAVMKASEKIDPEEFIKRTGYLGSFLNMVSYFLLHLSLLILLFFSRKD